MKMRTWPLLGMAEEQGSIVDMRERVQPKASGRAD